MSAYDERTALIVVDVQNDFADPAGSLYVAGGEDVISVANREARAAAAAGALVAYSQDWHPETTPHFSRDGGTWPVHCIGGSWGADLSPHLQVIEGSLRIRKGSGGEDGYSAFSVRDPASGETSSTELGARLKERGVERVVIVGLATDVCVKETALDALRLGFDVTVLRSGVRAVDLQPGDGDRALQDIAAAGATVE